MIGAIEDYADHNGFTHGLFLVGAAHRKAIADKVQVKSRSDLHGIEWELDVPFDA